MIPKKRRDDLMSSPADPVPLEACTDEELMQRIAVADQEAMAELTRRHHRRIMTLAYRFVGSWEIAEDIGQDALLRVLRAASSYHPEARFTTWLYRLVTNLCWDRRRRTARATRRLAEVARNTQVEGDPPGEVAGERAERVRRAISTLPDRQRLAVLLHRYEELSHRQIAEITGWSESAVESCLVRAYRALRKALLSEKME
jgi:RNA polymerase sigma-70 factor (ECF subfamily)